MLAFQLCDIIVHHVFPSHHLLVEMVSKFIMGLHETRMGMNPPDESFITCIIDVCGSYIPSPHTTTTKRTLPPPPTPFVFA